MMLGHDHLVSYNTPRNSTPPQDPDPDWRTYFYLVNQLIGGVGLSMLLLTMLWASTKHKPRNPLLISMCFSWWTSTFPCLCVLYYAGQVVGPPPAYGVCLASASLTMAQSILVAITGPSLIFHIWLVVRTVVSPRFVNDVWIARSTRLCLTLPYALFIASALITLWLGLRSPHVVHRAKFYCIVDEPILTMTISILGTVFVAVAIILEVWTIILLYKNRASIRQLSREGYELDIPLVLRVCVFGLYVFLGLCLDAMAIVQWAGPVPDLFYSTFGIAVFIVFGTQPDIWHIWYEVLRRAGNILCQFGTRYQTRSLPSPPQPLRLSYRSANALFTTPFTSQRYLLHSQQPSQPQPSRSNSFAQSQTYLRSYHRQSHVSSLLALPLPSLLRASHCDESPPVIIVHPTPALSNGTQCTPTSSTLPDLEDLYLDRPGKLSQSSSGFPQGLGFAQPPRLEPLDPAILATTLQNEDFH